MDPLAPTFKMYMFTIDHAQSCSTGGFPTIRHSEIRDFTANLMTEVCHDVCVEPPPLQPLSGEQLPHATTNREDNARLDIKARGFWRTPQQRAYFNVRVFNPHSTSYHDIEMTACYNRHEGENTKHTSIVSVRWNMAHLPHSYSALPEGWAELPP